MPPRTRARLPAARDLKGSKVMGSSSDRPSKPDFARLAATGKLKLARALGILLRGHPFHGDVASGWRARPDEAVGTMGVYWAHGAVQLVWAPSFVNRISDNELAGVLLHEVHHVVLRHPFVFPPHAQGEPGPDYDTRAALIAQEVSVNEFVTSLPLPGQPLLLEDFVGECPALEPYESTRSRYQKLHDPVRARHDYEARKKLREQVEELVATALDPIPDQAGEGSAATHTVGRAALSQSASPTSDSLVGLMGRLIDSHAGWDSFRKAGVVARLATAVAVSEALAKHGHLLPSDVRALIRTAHQQPGITAGGFEESLPGLAKSRLSWQHILRQVLAVDYDREITFLRPPRRFPEMVGVLPGVRRTPTKLKLMAAVDTSGSMSVATLDVIAAELRVLAEAYDVAIVEFDCIIQRRYRLETANGQHDDPSIQSLLGSFRGRGGTSFHPLFARDTLDWAADGGELSAVLVFSDGHGPAPQEAPATRTIWVLMDEDARHDRGGGVCRPAPWGEVIDTTDPHAPDA